MPINDDKAGLGKSLFLFDFGWWCATRIELYFYIVHCSCFVLVEIDWEFEEAGQSCT